MPVPAPSQPATAARAWLLAALMLCLSLLVPGVAAQEGHAPASFGATPSPATATAADERLDAAIRPELREWVRERVPATLPDYRITVTLEPQAERGNVPSLTGHLGLTYTNTTGEPLATLPFRLYANAPDAEHDAQLVSDVTVDGTPVDVSLSESDSVLEVPLAEPLAAGEEAVIEMGFASFLPIDSEDHYGIFGYNSDTGTWALAHWYPVLAGRDPSTGWVLDYPSRNGDPIFADTATFDVTVETAPDWRLVTTGVEAGEAVTTGEVTTRRFLSGPARDFAIVADEDFELVTEEANGVTINSWFNPGEERSGRAIAAYAAQAVALFDELLGPYPFRELDLMPVEMHGAAGCEFPQLIYMGQAFYEPDTDLSIPSQADFTVAHEVVHQWFYGLVGNNQYAHAFIDEGLTNYLSAQVYFEQQYGADEADAIMDTYLRRGFERIVDRGGDVVVDQPTDAFPSGNAYGFAAYVKAPLGFEAIRAEIGDEAYFGALQAYVGAFAFGVAEPPDLLAAFEASAGRELDDLWNHWFTETNGEEDI